LRPQPCSSRLTLHTVELACQNIVPMNLSQTPTKDDRVICEVIAIGDELISGQRLDTNTQWLSQRLTEQGFYVGFHSTIADDIRANIRVFREAFDRADIVIATGGLGPTADDLTRQAIAEATNRELVLDRAALEHIRGMFRSRGRDMPPQNEVQALFPEGSLVIDNPHGTAPGIDLTIDRSDRGPSRVFALPGVPAEMKEMWHASVDDCLAELQGDRPATVIRHHRIKCFGVGESTLEQMLPDLIRRGRTPSVGITVSQATITLRITAAGQSPDACLQAMTPTIETIHECLGELVFGSEDEELQDVVIGQLRSSRATLATVECGTAGLIAQWLGHVPGSSSVFLGGSFFPDQQRAAASLRADEGNNSSLSESQSQVAGMAQAARRQCGADFGLAVGQFHSYLSDPGTDVDSNVERERFVYALATPHTTIVKTANLGGHPELLRARCAKQALNLLRQTLASEK